MTADLLDHVVFFICAGGDSREIKCYRVVVVSLGLLCVLLVIAVRVAAKHITETQLNNDNLTQNGALLQARITNLTRENEKLMNSVCKYFSSFEEVISGLIIHFFNGNKSIYVLQFDCRYI